MQLNILARKNDLLNNIELELIANEIPFVKQLDLSLSYLNQTYCAFIYYAGQSMGQVRREGPTIVELNHLHCIPVASHARAHHANTWIK